MTGTPTTLGGYGITDAKIANGTITLGSNSITPLTDWNSSDNYAFKSVKVKANSTNASQVTAQDSDVVVTADSNTDTLNIAVGNKWIRALGTANSDTVTFGHLTRTETSSETTGSITSSANTFTVPSYSFDEAGHETGVTTKTYTVIFPSSDNQKITSKNGTAAAVSFGANDTVQLTSGKGIAVIGDATAKTVTFDHANEVTAASNVGGNTDENPGYNSTFTVPYFSYDSYGHITGSGTKAVKIPASDNTNQTITAKNGTASTVTTFGASSAVELVAGNNIGITTGTNSITIANTYTHPEYASINSTGGLSGTTLTIPSVSRDTTGHVGIGSFTLPFKTAPTSSNKVITESDISGIVGAMVYQGTIGTGGTITTLPTASASNKGYVYMVKTAGTYDGKACEVGDMIISNGASWDIVNGENQVTNSNATITVPATNTAGSSVTLATVDGTNITAAFKHATSGVTAGSYGPAANAYLDFNGSFSVPYITVNSAGHITAASQKTISVPGVGDWGVVHITASDTNSLEGTSDPFFDIQDNSDFYVFFEDVCDISGECIAVFNGMDGRLYIDLQQESDVRIYPGLYRVHVYDDNFYMDLTKTGSRDGFYAYGYGSGNGFLMANGTINHDSYLTSHQSIKKIISSTSAQTAPTTAQAIAGTGNITLHKVAWTGTYSDLIGTPTIPAAANDGKFYVQANSNPASQLFSANSSSNSTLKFVNGTNTTVTQSTASGVTTVTVNSSHPSVTGASEVSTAALYSFTTDSFGHVNSKTAKTFSAASTTGKFTETSNVITLTEIDGGVID